MKTFFEIYLTYYFWFSYSATPLPVAKATCSPNQFTCVSDGSRIPIAYRCDGQNQCPVTDDSDEQGCSKCKNIFFKENL